MAEAIAKKIISDRKEDLAGITVTSAGIFALEGQKAADNAIKIAEENGLNLAEFRAKAINPQLIQEADIILTMTNSHKEQLQKLVPEAKGKTFLLKEYSGNLEEAGNLSPSLEVGDPFGQPIHVYRACYKELSNAIEKALARIAQKES